MAVSFSQETQRATSVAAAGQLTKVGHTTSGCGAAFRVYVCVIVHIIYAHIYSIYTLGCRKLRFLTSKTDKPFPLRILRATCRH